MPTLTNEILTAALEGLELQKGRIDEQIAEIRQMLGSRPAPAAKAAEEFSVDAPGTSRGRRKLSAAARKRIAEAQRKRWAAVRGDSEPSAKAQAPRKERKMSAAGRKRIAEAAKKRWAEFRKQKAAASKPAPKAAKKAAKKGAKRGRKPAKAADQPAAAAETSEG